MNDESMYFDPTQFDFTSLVDVIESDEKPTAANTVKTKEADANGGYIDDISDLENLFLTDDEETEEETEEDPNADIKDLQPVTEADQDAITLFNEIPDNAELLIGNEKMTKQQIKEMKEANQAFENQRELVATAANSLDQIHRHITNNHVANRLAIDTNIETLTRKLNSGLDPVEYGNTARQLQQAQEAKQMFNLRVAEEMQLLDIERAETTRFRIAQADQALRAEIPQWDNLKGGLLQDMQKRGINLAELEKVWSKDVALMALNDYRYRMQKTKAEETAIAAAKAKAARSTSTAANANRVKAQSDKEAKKQALLKRQQKGLFTREDHAKMFDFLTD
ncbi:hypothetical protein ACLIX5_004465 [Salmonella enterica subsp. enterica serovar Bredeney]